MISRLGRSEDGAGHASQDKDCYRAIGRRRRLRLFQGRHSQFWNGLHVKLAEYPAPKNTKWLNQNVADKDIGWFYHADQGTRTFGMPYEWFMALEQPSLTAILWSADPFSDPAYLDRYGFIPDPSTRRRCRSASRMATRCWIRRVSRGATRAPSRT